MAFSHGAIAKLYANGYDLSPYLQQVTLGGSTEPGDVTAIGQTTTPFYRSYISGPVIGEASADGLFDGTTTVPAIDKVMNDALGLVGGSVVSYLPVGDGFGYYGYGLLADETKYDVQTVATAVAKSSAAMRSSSGMERAVIACALAQKSSTSAGSNIDNTSGTTNGGVGYLQVTAVTGSNGGTVLIQHSTNNADWSTLVTFVASTAISAQRVAVTGTVNRHIRASWTIGATSSLTILAMFCRK